MLARQYVSIALVLAAACEATPYTPYEPAPGEEWPVADEPNQCDRAQRILLDDVVNARDLGGVPLLGLGSTACSTLFRGPPLSSSSPNLCGDVASLGIQTVIDLRTDGERASVPDASCVTDTTRVVSAPLPIPYNVSPADYIADLNASESIAIAFAALSDDSAYPIYFHCTWGRDRTGILAALVLAALGASREAILEDYTLSSWTVGAYPDSLRAALDEVDRRGGIEAYLSSVGVSAEQLSALRARLVTNP